MAFQLSSSKRVGNEGDQTTHGVPQTHTQEQGMIQVSAENLHAF